MFVGCFVIREIIRMDYQKDYEGDNSLNIILVLMFSIVWLLVIIANLLSDTLSNMILFDALILLSVCGISYHIKSYSFVVSSNLIISILAIVLIHLAYTSSQPTFLLLLGSVVIVASILLSFRWVFVFAIACTIFTIPAENEAHVAIIIGTIWVNVVLVMILKSSYANKIKIASNFQDYALQQMQDARESRAELVALTKQLREYQNRIQRLNNRLEAAVELADQARQLKTRFATNVSHELRTPINLIVGFSEVLALNPEVYDTPLPACYRADIHAVYRNGKHLQSLINDILDISQLESNYVALVKEKSSLSAIIDDATSMIADLIVKKGLELYLEVPDDLPLLWFDPIRVRQILLNLLSNAVKYTDEGSITITVKREQKQIVTSIKDTGCGISNANRDLIFEEFYRGDDEKQNREIGTGLGLAVSKALIDQHGGRIWVESDGIPGQGSAFSFSLPISTRLLNPSPYASPSSTRKPYSKHILVVDEDEMIVNFFRRYVKSDSVHVCTNEQQALEMLEAKKPEFLILSDEHQFQTLVETANAPNNMTTLITCPIYTGRKLLQSYGVLDYLVKPVSTQQLYNVLSRIEQQVKHVMIIDDNRDIIRLFTKLLLGFNTDYDISACATGEDGITAMMRRSPDLVILDIMMPGITGFDVIKQMKSHPQLSLIPIILISAKGGSEAIMPHNGTITVHRSQAFTPSELVKCLDALVSSINSPTSSILQAAHHD